jgi:hypothetical protein
MDTIEPASVPKKRAGCWRMTWQRALIALLVAEVTIVELVMMFQEPKARTVAVSAFVCGLTTMTFRLAIHGARRFWKPPQIHGCLNVWCEIDYQSNNSANASRGRPSWSFNQMQKLCKAILAARRA